MTCTSPSKASFPTLDVAVRALLGILSREKAWKRPARPVRAYQCPGCSAFHLTSQGTTFYTPHNVVEAREMLHKVAS